MTPKLLPIPQRTKEEQLAGPSREARVNACAVLLEILARLDAKQKKEEAA